MFQTFQNVISNIDGMFPRRNSRRMSHEADGGANFREQDARRWWL